MKSDFFSTKLTSDKFQISWVKINKDVVENSLSEELSYNNKSEIPRQAYNP